MQSKPSGRTRLTHKAFKMFRRIRAKLTRTLAAHFARRELRLEADRPLVSFSFDDAPRSALSTGARILEAHGARGTYYLSLGLLGTTSELGPIGDRGDVERAVTDGHELGCHTHDHHDAWTTSAHAYLASVERNRAALVQWLPQHGLRSFAYPKNGATLAVKSALAARFECCRGGGQTFNAGTADLNLLNACFIDQRARVDLQALRALIELNAERRGWLIFAAHDISEESSPFACSPRTLEALVRMSLETGADVLPVAAAWVPVCRSAAPGEALPRRHQPTRSRLMAP
jgi:peptidoglycan/xylan/chitin deacetylase (PgdA/CDA1 family)